MRVLGLAAGIATSLAAMVSCGDVIRQGQSPVVLVINSLQGASGGGHAANTFSGTLFSDVQVLVTTPPCSVTSPCPTTFSDSGQVILQLAPKNVAIAPTSNNQVTITRYHVEFIRADGRNTPGVDVPYAFDGAVTGTVPDTGTASITFELVRHTAKVESPLAQLVNSSAVIYTIAQVTFYGTDLVGNAISIMGSIAVDFGNFGDS
ncbi:MAG TPA: hypothetical protein VGY48_32945 [Vicinamibacterales bacterium]|nr:hypothetical protein [Vicinamibacterales bacterium]